MRNVLIALLFALCITSATMLNAREPLSSLRQLCVADDSTGFHWRSGAWKQVNFVKPKYVVSKTSYPNVYPKASKDATNEEILLHVYCTTELRDQMEIDDESFKSYRSCLKVQRVGEEKPQYFPCEEFHVQGSETRDWNVSFSCAGTVSQEKFHMRPNGHFHMGRIHGDLQESPKGGYKDSLVIDVGKCVEIAN